MFTGLVKAQLVIFTVASVIGVSALLFSYVQVPMLLGIGRITVTLELPTTGGLYQFGNVTYRGVQIGKVVDVAPTREGAKATLSLDSSPRVPADVQAEVRSVSAVGEQYVELRPRTAGAPYLADGSVIPMRDAVVPQQVGPMLDQVSALLASIPKGRVTALLDESFTGLNGAGYDIASLIDSSAALVRDIDATGERPRRLVEDTAPLLNSQAQTADALRIWTRDLANVTEELARNDSEVRTLLRAGPGATEEVSRLLEQVKPTLPVLLANLSSVGQIGVTYNASLEQLLVLLPPFVAAVQAALPGNNPTGIALGEFRIAVGDPPACTVGYLPPSAWRSPADTTVIDTPDGLYCKLPQDSPIAVRGARNYPCMGYPGKRAPTVEICRGEQPFTPVAERQHVVGPYPIDPNLVSQGIPPDDRITLDENIFAPAEGTAPPVGQQPPPASPPAAPSGNHATGPPPPVAVTQYSPSTGQFVAQDGRAYRQTNLAEPPPKDWKDLLPR
ncbi:virulence factor Mce [Mycobacterium gallinarum]|uniref:Virulence factor Mce n=1 Tax=Mycobacterium gallinarum TaxID=39689 RepID=A0A9W4BNT1_9MYCO|nr:MlaD family protein [Mycobacterium gallinarum]BBY95549.1 virulence factor Mce [Mycobacterium gallinarum]